MVAFQLLRERYLSRNSLKDLLIAYMIGQWVKVRNNKGDYFKVLKAKKGEVGVSLLVLLVY